MTPNMAAFPTEIPEPYPSSNIDHLNRLDLLAQMPQITTYPLRKSITMEEDKSQPPTPDGTGLPVNFAQIGPGIYRASYPQAAHFSVLQQYKFKTIITFVPEDIPLDYQSFMRTDGITHHQIHVLANKNVDVYTDDEVVSQVIKLMLDPVNHPMLIHCNKGKHRTGCMTACFRKVCGWSLEACMKEYEQYSKPKSRDLDEDFITRFTPSNELKSLALNRGFICEAFSEPYTGWSKESDLSNWSNYTAETDDSLMTQLHVGDSCVSNSRRISLHEDHEAGYSTDDSLHRKEYEVEKL